MIRETKKTAVPAARSDAELAGAALAWAAGGGKGGALAREIAAGVGRRRKARRVALASAAGALALLIAGWVWMLPARSVSPANASVAASAAPEAQALPDGSRIELRPGARIAVEFSGAVRRVALLEGEAYFAVAKDAARPFVVAAHGVEVRAVGTEFSVGLGAGRVEVIVTEGRVAVDHASVAAPLATLAAGDRATVNPAAPAVAPVVEKISAAALAAGHAWRVPRLELAATPLGEVVALFNRHGPVRLALDPALADLRLGGALRADNTEALLRLLRDEFGLVAEPRDGALHLRRR
jgi:transmembrane sensor